MENYEQILKERFNISYLKPYQELIISRIMEDKAIGSKLGMLASLPTGAGKSLCFMLPAAISEDYMVLIYPLLSLMNDQAKRFAKAGIKAEMLRGGMDRKEKEESILRLRSKESHVLITNIEMLLVLIARRDLDFMRDKPLSIVLDEAHTIVTWGNSFRSSYLKIPEVISYFNPSSILAFTATMDEKIQKGLISMIFSGKKPYMIHASCDRPNIFYSSILSISKEHDIIEILQRRELRPAVIFSKTREETEELARYLSCFFDVRHYHAGLDKEKKKEIENWFEASSDGIISATIAFGMGIDKASIRTVIHTYLPSSASAFIQEAGRGGRDGKPSYSIVLYYEDEESPLKNVFCGRGCIRSGILRAMNEYPEEEQCLACSACTENPFHPSGESMLLKCMKTHRLHNKSKVRRILLPHFPKCRSKYGQWKDKEISVALNHLKAQGLITESRYSYRLTERGRNKHRMLERNTSGIFHL